MTQAPTVGTYLALFFMCLWASGYSDMAASKSPFERMKRLVNPLQTTSAVRLFPSPPLSASKLKKDQIKFFFKNNAIIEPSAKIYWYLKLSALIKKNIIKPTQNLLKLDLLSASNLFQLKSYLHFQIINDHTMRTWTDLISPKTLPSLSVAKTMELSGPPTTSTWPWLTMYISLPTSP